VFLSKFLEIKIELKFDLKNIQTLCEFDQVLVLFL